VTAPVPTEKSLPRPLRRAPELLAPAGDWECARAAVENGADAIYFGLEKFNARMRAHNFTESDLPELMRFLHLRGVRAYVTFNTLVFPDELGQAERYLRSIIAAGVDAAIVQDVGVCRMIRAISPDFPIHASTQMTVTSAAGVEFAQELGCSLVVLARECSIREIEKIQQGSAQADATAFPLEVFVHGALCVAYSGQCLTSEALGGRSANRGECAQACRMPYDLISDGKQIRLGDRRYLLSPQDLSGLEVLPDIIKSGVASLKIEGRLKSPEYVANITKVYRQAIDQIIARNVEAEAGTGNYFTSADVYDLQMGFSRGIYSGWFRGINNQKLVHARFGKKRGVFIGQVRRVDPRREEVFVTREGPIKPGDGLVFDFGHPDEKEEGGRVYTSRVHRNELVLTFGRGNINFSRVHVGDRVWKTSDPELDRRVRQTFASAQPGFQRPVDFEVHGVVGEPLTIILRDELGHVVRQSSLMPLERAEKHSLTAEKLREQLGRLGSTPFQLRDLISDLPDGLLLPFSELNRLRRELVANLEELRTAPHRWSINETSHVPRLASGKASAQELELIVLARNLSQVQAALEGGVKTLYCDFEDPKKYRDAVHLFHSICRDQTRPCDLRCAPADLQIRRRMDFETGPIVRCRRLLGPQLRSPQIFC
jgi:putative protease